MSTTAHSPILHCAACGAPAAPGTARCDYCLTRLASVACPSCLALSAHDALHCAQCGARLAREAGTRADGEAPFRCPACTEAMRQVHVGSLEMEECPACDGAWLAAATFERLCADAESQAAVLHHSTAPTAAATGHAPDPVRYRPCPACGAVMNRHNFSRTSGVILDVCSAHGTFFDRAELHRVVTFIRGGGLERARERRREQLAEEERRIRALQMVEARSAAGRSTSPFSDPTPTKTRIGLELLVSLLGW